MRRKGNRPRRVEPQETLDSDYPPSGAHKQFTSGLRPPAYNPSDRPEPFVDPYGDVDGAHVDDVTLRRAPGDAYADRTVDMAADLQRRLQSLAAAEMPIPVFDEALTGSEPPRNAGDEYIDTTQLMPNRPRRSVVTALRPDLANQYKQPFSQRMRRDWQDAGSSEPSMDASLEAALRSSGPPTVVPFRPVRHTPLERWLPIAVLAVLLAGLVLAIRWLAR
jgi:hypothetical protein